MKCQNCNSELLEDAKFCTTCGTPVAAAPAGPVCPKCNAPMLPDARFCTTGSVDKDVFTRLLEGRLPEAASSPR